MPFLIKSSNGKRVITAPSVSVSKESNLKDDIVAALKGLTFKIEIKIADIIVTPPDELKPTEPLVQRPNHDLARDDVTTGLQAVPKPERVELARPTLVPQPKLIKRELDQSDNLKDRLDPVEKRPIETATINKAIDVIPTAQKVPELNGSQHKDVVAAPKVEEQQPITTKPTNDLTTDKTVYEKPAVLKVPEPPAPTPETEVSSPPRATLKIGSHLETCCIAVDDRSNPPAAYIPSDDKALMSLSNSISEAGADIERLPELTSFSIGKTVFAKSTEDNSWYRASIVGLEDNRDVDIFFFDWGLREIISPQRVRDMTPEFSKYPIFALKIEFIDTPKTILDEVLKCENLFKMYVDSYNEVSGCYRVKVSGQVTR